MKTDPAPTGEWPIKAKRPMVPGHEIAGVVTRAGPLAKHKIGDVVCVGTRVDACRTCTQCKQGEQSYCKSAVDTYGGTHKPTQQPTHGGFADRMIVDADFVFSVPATLPLSTAAPLMCAGVTSYAPLKRLYRPGAVAGVLGIGGLGHVALQFAKAIGYSQVVAFTSSKDKQRSARRFGADDVAVISDADDMNRFTERIDVLLVTVSHEVDWEAFLKTLRTDGVLCMVGKPSNPTLTFPHRPLMGRRLSIMGSKTGGLPITQEMLDVAAENNIRVEAEEFPLTPKGANDAIQRVDQCTARFRCVLVADGLAGNVTPEALQQLQ